VLSRHERNLGQSRQEKIKNVPAPPTRSDGKDGDMYMCNGILYIKMNFEWHQFDPVPKPKGLNKPYVLDGDGWDRLSSGLIIQWGEQSSSFAELTNDSEYTVTFPKEFTNECFKVIATIESRGSCSGGSSTGSETTRAECESASPSAGTWTTAQTDGGVVVSEKSKTGCKLRFEEWVTVTQNAKFVYIAIGY